MQSGCFAVLMNFNAEWVFGVSSAIIFFLSCVVSCIDGAIRINEIAEEGQNNLLVNECSYVDRYRRQYR